MVAVPVAFTLLDMLDLGVKAMYPTDGWIRDEIGLLIAGVLMAVAGVTVIGGRHSRILENAQRMSSGWDEADAGTVRGLLQHAAHRRWSRECVRQMSSTGNHHQHSDEPWEVCRLEEQVSQAHQVEAEDRQVHGPAVVEWRKSRPSPALLV